jgi:hypothetical protein
MGRLYCASLAIQMILALAKWFKIGILASNFQAATRALGLLGSRLPFNPFPFRL